jgi:hypothetical protein
MSTAKTLSRLFIAIMTVLDHFCHFNILIGAFGVSS